MLDTHILAAVIGSRQAYEQIYEIVSEKDFTPPVGFWYDLVRDYYKRDPAARSVERGTLRELGQQAITNPKQTEGLLSVLDGLDSSISSPNVVSAVLDMRRRNLILELAAASNDLGSKQATKAFDALIDIWDKQEVTKESEIEYAKDWAELDSVVGKDRRISLGISSLDQRIGGGVLPGHHILVFGRTEIGKSCFTIALTANLLRNGLRVLYAGNEDEINILKARVRLSLLQKPQEWVDRLPKRSARLLEQLAGDRLTMVKVVPGSISELEDLTAKHTPNVLVVDQIRNLVGPEDGMTQRMEHNAIRFRSLLNREKLIGLSVTQAGDRSQGHNQDGPLYLSAGDVDSSRVGLPGTADLQVGIGSNKEMMARGLRMLNFAKNKLSSDPGSREPLIVRFDLARSMVINGDE